MFFEGSVRSTRRTSFSGLPRDQLALRLEHGVARGELVELGRVDRDRVHRHERAAVFVVDEALAEVGFCAGHVAGGAHEVQAHWCVWNPTRSLASTPSWIARRIRSGQHMPVVGLRPRDVDEVREQRVRRALAHELRREVEVVVVEEDRRLGLGLELLEHGLGEGLVDLRVAAVPGVLQRDVDRRLVRELPEVVLEEPEHRVRDDVVEPVVGRLVVCDEAQAKRRAVARALLDRGPARLDRDRPVLVAHRAGDPGHVVVARRGSAAR